MQVRLIIFTFLLVTIKDIFCSRLGGLKYAITSECPSQEDIPKCSCKVVTRGLSITCRNFKTDSEYQNHLKSMQGYLLRNLEVNNYNALSVPTDLYEGQHIEHLSFNYLEMDDPSFKKGKRHLLGLEKSLDTLTASKSFRLKPLMHLELDHLEYLKHVIFEQNNIPEVGNDWFTSGPKELSTLIFEKNGIEELGNEAFASLENLKILAIAGNHLNTISRSMLPKSAPYLSNLDLAYNKIRSLPKDIFSNMPALQEVNLEYNLIHMIPEDTWGPVASQILSLNLKGSPLQCNDKMKWICKTKFGTSRAEGKCSNPLNKAGLTLQRFCEKQNGFMESKKP